MRSVRDLAAVTMLLFLPIHALAQSRTSPELVVPHEPTRLEAALQNWFRARARIYGRLPSRLLQENENLHLERLAREAELQVLKRIARLPVADAERLADILRLEYIKAIERDAARLNSRPARGSSRQGQKLQNENRLQKLTVRRLETQIENLMRRLPATQRELIKRAAELRRQSPFGKDFRLKIEYDHIQNVSYIFVKDIPIVYGSAGLSKLQLGLWFQWSGRVHPDNINRQPELINLTLMSAARDWRFLKSAKSLTLLLNRSKRLVLRCADEDSEVSDSAICLETLTYTIPAKTLLVLANATSIEAQVGPVDFLITKDGIAVFRFLVDKLNLSPASPRTAQPANKTRLGV